MKKLFVKWSIYLPIIILFIMALNQFRLVYTKDLSPWLGAGFGMFSTTDSISSRYLFLYGKKTSDELHQLAIPKKLEDFAERVRGLPDKYFMAELIRQYHNYVILHDCPDEPLRCSYPNYRLEVWRTNYDAESLKPLLEKISFLDFKSE